MPLLADADAVYLGSSSVDRLYLGTFQVWPALTAALAGVAPMPVGALVGSLQGGPLAATAPVPSGALAGTVRLTGAAAGTAPAPVGGLAGTVTQTGALAATAPMPVGALTTATTGLIDSGLIDSATIG